jgi:uncharacterized protein
VPLRTFGQLKQLWEARTDEPGDQTTDSTSSVPQSASSPPAETPALPSENSHSAETPSPLTTDSDRQPNLP